jgi:euchromatic histone-lysine N-methyltransferase
LIFLQNNMEQSVPVRVICEHKRGDNQSGKVYTYCGLYKVGIIKIYLL